MNRKIKIIFCLFFVVFALASCDPVTYDSKCTLTVYVYSGALPPEGEPLDRALVTLTPGTANDFTGSDGIVVFEDLQVTNHQFKIQAQKEGYSTNWVNLTLHPGREETAYIILEPKPSNP